MNCPRCHEILVAEEYKGIEIDRCSKCQGMWLDFHEMDQLEDTVMDEDESKGSIMFRSYDGDMACPACQNGMQMFHYRAFDVELDFCPSEHGFWLDKGEEKKILETMKQRIKDLKRSSSAEVEWANMLRQFKSKSFIQRMRGLFRR